MTNTRDIMSLVFASIMGGSEMNDTITGTIGLATSQTHLGTMKTCEKCGSKNVTRHHILPKCMFGGYGGICYLCRFHHNEIEVRYLKTERQMSDGFKGRYRLSAIEYKQIMEDYLNETTPLHPFQIENVVAIKRKFVVRDCRLR